MIATLKPDQRYESRCPHCHELVRVFGGLQVGGYTLAAHHEPLEQGKLPEENCRGSGALIGEEALQSLAKL